MKKAIVWCVCMALCLGLAACAAQPAPAPAPSDGETESGETETGENSAAGAEAAYQAKLSELTQTAEDGEVHWAVCPCGSGEDLLLVAPSVYADGEAMEADVYQYAEGEVKFITSISSTGSAYPLSFTDEAVLFGGNHTAGKLAVYEGTGELYQLLNMNIEGKAPVLEAYDVTDGQQTLKSSEELSPEEADAFDFYTNAFAEERAEIISFQ